jgi:hypothetical protein
MVFLLAACAAAAAGETPPDGNTVEPGFEERVRSENWDNLKDFSDASADTQHQLRLRTRVWGRFDFGPKVELMLMLNDESKKVFTPDTRFHWDETIVENLYLDVHRGGTWSARVGRQNLMRGDGFVLFDGNALDGSRTAYFNALDVTRSLGKKSKLELIAISDPSHDTYLPVFNDRNKALTEWDERAVGAYYTGKDIPRTGIEAYCFHKTETDDFRPGTNPARQPDRRVETLGGRVEREIGKGWSAAGELAVQWGSQDPGVPVRAWGGTATIRKKFDVPAKPSVSLAWIGLSGDDPTTGKIEGWDPLFSRWPKWSELYIYTLAGEKGVAYWTNLGMWQLEALASPWKPLSLRATYYKMGAFHPFPGNANIYGTGRNRGDLYELRADVAAGSHFKGHVLYEHLAPGDFYAGSDPARFFRAEVTYTFKRTLAL